jgi:hypothetical protein
MREGIVVTKTVKVSDLANSNRVTRLAKELSGPAACAELVDESGSGMGIKVYGVKTASLFADLSREVKVEDRYFRNAGFWRPKSAEQVLDPVGKNGFLVVSDGKPNMVFVGILLLADFDKAAKAWRLGLENQIDAAKAFVEVETIGEQDPF